jgi:hypothetical protein
MSDLYRGILGTPNQKWDDDTPGKNSPHDLENRMRDAQPMPIFKGTLIPKEQYAGLASIARQYGMTLGDLESATHGELNDERVVVGNGGLLVLTMSGYHINTPDKVLTIPDIFTNLLNLFCDGCNLSAIQLPPTLTMLRELAVDHNNLTELSLPGEYEQIRELYCDNNALTTLYLPPTYSRMEGLFCGNNRLTTLRIPQTYTCLKSVGCRSNPLDQDTQQALDALKRKGVLVWT